MDKRELVDAEPAAPLGGSRSTVLNVLRASGPMGVREVAEQTGLHPNTIRFHLDGLVEAGLAERTVEERAQPGRPRTFYRASSADRGTRSYRLLAQILTSLITGTMPNPVKAAIEAGQAWGRYLTDRVAPFQRIGSEEALDRLTGLLTDIGFVSRTESDAEGAVIRLVHCPFREIAEENQKVICPLHLGLIQGALAEMNAPLTADRLDPFVEPQLCLAHLSRSGDSASG